MKRFLIEARGEGREFSLKMVMLKEKTMDLECKVQYLVAQLHDMKSSL